MKRTRTTLVLGGVRSGKSRLAERLAREGGLAVTYIATAADYGDAEMRARITTHRERRPPEWLSVEAPLHLADTLRAQEAPDRCLLVDCLTLWLGQLLCAPDPALLAREREALLDTLPALRGELILVSNETGLGVVPLGELTRRFLDEAGLLHQRLAQHCERVILTVAGLPHCLKG
jgi:adenosylcobinamide kinase/adenosylcobinamide-phosphate guanylyltransferase